MIYTIYKKGQVIRSFDLLRRPHSLIIYKDLILSCYQKQLLHSLALIRRYFLTWKLSLSISKTLLCSFTSYTFRSVIRLIRKLKRANIVILSKIIDPLFWAGFDPVLVQSQIFFSLGGNNKICVKLYFTRSFPLILLTRKIKKSRTSHFAFLE